MKDKTLIVITGPTGVGKTELTLRLAELFHTSVLNADSRQIFSEIPIGTAAPTEEEQKRARHYFVGSHHLTDYYSASLFEQDVLRILDRLDNPLAILSGGSMMYIDAVCNGIDDIPTISQPLRDRLKFRIETEGLAPLLDELKVLDPKHWEIVDRNNPRRVVHALEICKQTGRPYSSFLTNRKKERPFKIVKIGLNRPREELYDRINRRVLQMIDNGMIAEARRVYPYRQLNSLNTVGYKELFCYLDGLLTLDEAIFQIQSNTRRYARKQLTWFRRDPNILWLHPDNISENTLRKLI